MTTLTTNGSLGRLSRPLVAIRRVRDSGRARKTLAQTQSNWQEHQLPLVKVEDEEFKITFNSQKLSEEPVKILVLVFFLDLSNYFYHVDEIFPALCYDLGSHVAVLLNRFLSPGLSLSWSRGQSVFKINWNCLNDYCECKCIFGVSRKNRPLTYCNDAKKSTNWKIRNKSSQCMMTLSWHFQLSRSLTWVS